MASMMRDQPTAFYFSLPEDTNRNDKKAQAIQAAEIKKAIKAEKSIFIENAVIIGSLSLKFAVIEREITIRRTIFEEELDFSFATFKRTIDLQNSTFEKEVTFSGSKLQADLFLSGAHFKSKADFSDFNIAGVCYSRETQLRRTKFKGEADFEGAVFNKRIEFHSTLFEHDAEFKSVQILGNAEFPKVRFLGQANFNNANISGAIFFRAETPDEGSANEPAMFAGLVDFIGVKIDGQAIFIACKFHHNVRFGLANIGFINFSQAKFLRQSESDEINVDFVAAFAGDAEFTNAEFHGNVSFNSAKISRSAFFNNVKFLKKPKSPADRNVDFISANIGGSAEFTNAVFHGNISFSGIHIGGSAFFNDTKFLKDAESSSERNVDFVSVSIDGNAEFLRSKFSGNVNFYSSKINSNALFSDSEFSDSNAYVSFSLVQIVGAVYFDDCKFLRQVRCNGMRASGDLYLRRAKFERNVSFENCSFKTIYFDLANAPDFMAGVDFRGCVYDRIEPIKYWEGLARQIRPYDRQPFAQLELTVRSSGDDHLANRIYYERERRRAGWIKENRAFNWRLEIVKDGFLRFLTGYGVRTWLVFLYILALMIIGTLVFQKEGAVQPKDIENPPFEAERLPWGDAAWITLDMILPISIQNGSGWQPSYKFLYQLEGFETGSGALGIRYTDVATLLTLCGWILIPVGVASITGILKRP